MKFDGLIDSLSVPNAASFKGSKENLHVSFAQVPHDMHGLRYKYTFVGGWRGAITYGKTLCSGEYQMQMVVKRDVVATKMEPSPQTQPYA
jgi:hypothetical protein